MLSLSSGREFAIPSKLPRLGLHRRRTRNPSHTHNDHVVRKPSLYKQWIAPRALLSHLHILNDQSQPRSNRTKLLDDSVDHRQVKYLNNKLEADHGAITIIVTGTLLTITS